MKQEEIIIEAASKVHEDWCIQEYKGFFDRARQIYQNGEKNIASAFYQACYKGSTKRNELELDIQYLLGHQTMFVNCINDFQTFMKLVNVGGITVKRFTERKLTLEEQSKFIKTNDYKLETSEENILRDFRALSSSSKTENLEAAISAYTVFEQFSKAGISLEQMQTNNEIRNLIGVAIHTEWLKRNPSHQNNSLKVAYLELDEWTKKQDLTVFDALVSVAKKNNVIINKEESFVLPNYLLEEQIVLEDIKNKIM